MEDHSPHVDDIHGDLLSGRTMSLAEAVRSALEQSLAGIEKPSREARQVARGVEGRAGGTEMAEAEVAGHLFPPRYGDGDTGHEKANPAERRAEDDEKRIAERFHSASSLERNALATLVEREQSMLVAEDDGLSADRFGDVVHLQLIVSRHMRALSRARALGVA
jgi:23S rRNA G2069 N7-methylase RlmK/C1962 C5-methylase RlmI